MNKQMTLKGHDNNHNCNYNCNHNRKRRSQKRRVNILSVLTTLLLSVVCCVVFGGFLTSAHGTRTEEKDTFQFYKSITVESGDTLWGLAEEYITDDCDSIEEYVSKLRTVNHLYDDTLKAGDHIIIVYNNTI